MHILTEMIVNRLRFKHPSIQYDALQNFKLKNACIYNGQSKTNYLYIINALDLAQIHPTVSQCTFLILNASAASSPDILSKLPEGNDLIFIYEEDTDRLYLLNDILEIFDLYNDWEEQITGFSYDFEGIKNMLEYSKTIFNGYFSISDTNFNYVYTDTALLEDQEYFDEKNKSLPNINMIKDMISEPFFYECETLHEVFVYPNYNCDVNCLCYNFFKKGQYTGRLLFMNSDSKYTLEQKYLLHFLGELINKLIDQLHSPIFSSPNYINFKELMMQMLSGIDSPAIILEQSLGEIEWKKDDDFILILMKSYFPKSALDTNYINCISLESLSTNSFATPYKNDIVHVINISRLDIPYNTLFNKINEFIRENMFRMGISRTFNNFSNLLYAYRQAQNALKLGQLQKDQQWSYHFKDFALDYIIDNSLFELPAEFVCHPGLLKLMKYDKTNHTDLFVSLKTHIDCKYSITMTAEKLFIHRTTLLDRLKRICIIHPFKLDDPKELLYIRISYEILTQRI